MMKNIEDLLDFYLTANNETRKNVTGLIKEAINSSVKVADNKLVIGILGKDCFDMINCQSGLWINQI